MLHLDKHLRISEDTARAADLTHLFGKVDLDRIGVVVAEGYEKDLRSRSQWATRAEAAQDLALQFVKVKTSPWPDCANIAFPLLTIAALQFHSRAYPTLINGTEVVKFRTIGSDPDGKEVERAERVGCHMSYQCLEEDEGWEEVHDRLLIVVPIVGCAFTKVQFNSTLGYNETTLVMARDLVIDYYAKSVSSARRKTHVLYKYRNEIWEKVKLGAYRDVLEESWYKESAERPPEDLSTGTDNRRGAETPQSDAETPYVFLEQHCWLDLDGDGYAEPYVVLVELSSKCVVRLVARWDRKEDVTRLGDGTIISIQATEPFTKYSLLPSPDGGIYDMGFGTLLGPLNETVNTLINQLVDAGTMQTTAGGFLGRGVKIRGGVYTFSPLEWKRVDSTGDDLRKNIFPLPVRDPSTILFQLLGLIIDYTNRVSGATEMLAGQNPGQNTPAANGDHMVEQGLKIYGAIFKRVWRSMKQEFKKLYVLNAINLPTTKAYPGGTAMREDYLGDPKRICPAADPNVVSDTMRMQQAAFLAQRAMSVPGYDIKRVEMHILRASKIEGAESFYPGPEKTGPLPNPKVQVETMKLEGMKLKLQADAMQFSIEMMETHSLNEAHISQLQAQATKLLAEAQGVETGHQLAAINSQIAVEKLHNEKLMGRLKALLETVKVSHDISVNERELGILARKSSDAGASK